MKKHPCPDCKCCQACAETRCRLCRGDGGCAADKLSLAEQIALYDRINAEAARDTRGEGLHKEESA